MITVEIGGIPETKTGSSITAEMSPRIGTGTAITRELV